MSNKKYNTLPNEGRMIQPNQYVVIGAHQKTPNPVIRIDLDQSCFEFFSRSLWAIISPVKHKVPAVIIFDTRGRFVNAVWMARSIILNCDWSKINSVRFLRLDSQKVDLSRGNSCHMSHVSLTWILLITVWTKVWFWS